MYCFLFWWKHVWGLPNKKTNKELLLFTILCRTLLVFNFISRGLINKHGYHLVQAFRYAVDEINNGTQNKQLLPGVTLGYQTYDLCSLPASNLATLDLLAQQDNSSVVESRAVAIIGPDSSSYSFTPAAALGAFLVPQVWHDHNSSHLIYHHQVII